MAEPYKHVYKVDLSEPLKWFDIGDILAKGNEKANCFEVAVTRDGNEVDLTGCQVYGYFIRPDDETFKVKGTAEGNLARVELSKSCYVYDGAFSLAINIDGNGITQTVVVFDGGIVRTSSETINDGERVFYGLEDLLAQIAATEAAANSANTAAGNANTATERANQAAYAIEGITVSAEELDTGDATAELTVVAGKLHVHFGLPRGLKGDKGDPGTIENVTITSINGLPEALANVNAAKLGGKTPDQYLEAGGTAANAEKLGGKAPQYYLHPRNLLDNSNFVSPVNARGKTNYSGIAYYIDRWKSFADGTTVTIGSNGITFTGANIAQLVPVSLMKTGQTYTFAAKQADGTIRVATGTYPMSASVVQNGVTIKLDGLATQYVAITTAGTYEWAALYEGAYTAENLPPYVPKEDVTELAACQQYFVRIGGSAYTHIGSAYAQNETQLLCSVHLPQPMREGVMPSVVKGGELSMTAKSGTVFKNISAVTMNQVGVGALLLTLTSEGLTPGTVFDVYVPTGSWLDISADL